MSDDSRPYDLEWVASKRRAMNVVAIPDWTKYNHPAQTELRARAKRIAALEAEVTLLTKQLTLAKAFHSVAVKERDYERAIVMELQAKNAGSLFDVPSSARGGRPDD